MCFNQSKLEIIFCVSLVIFCGWLTGEITHAVVKRINHFLKTKKRDRIKPEMLEALLALKLHALNEAQAEAHRKEEEAKEAKKKKAKGFEPQMSKKDRKR